MKFFIILMLLCSSGLVGSDFSPWTKRIEDLSTLEKHVLIDKGTQRAFEGKYVSTTDKGVYKCKLCDTPLYVSSDKFASSCGWPSFDDAIKGAIIEKADKDGHRVEIVCANCGGHLGHVFRGEGLTAKNTRHCVNSVSLNFTKAQAPQHLSSNFKKAYFAGGCFWGVEYYLEKLKGVREVKSGFMGGHVKNPSYREVVRKGTGHIETVEVIYDANVVSYETLAKLFFEIHDPTQKDGQGPDIGSQYLSAIFVSNSQERKTIETLIKHLETKGFAVATKVLAKKPFYEAEAHHQDYYQRKGSTPYCHRRVKRF